MLVPFGTEEHIPKRRLPLVTGLIILLNLWAFWIELNLVMNGGEAALQAFFLQNAFIPANFSSIGAMLASPTLYYAMFLHAGLIHIASNILFFAPFGDNVEDRFGHFLYAAFYIACGVGAALAHALANPASVAPSVGASGAIAGVMAAYLVFFPRGTVRGLLFFFPLFTITTLPAMLFIGFWFIMQVLTGVASLGVTTAQSGGVAYFAHIGGFLTGLVLAGLYRAIKPVEPEFYS